MAKKKQKPVHTPAELLKIQKSNLERKNRGMSIFNKTPGIRSRVREHGRKALKQGTHPQMWRAKGPGGKLGAMGEMGEDVILEVNYIPGKLVKAHGIAGPYVDDLSRSLEANFDKQVHEPLEDYIMDKINIWVPSDTGSLRKAMESVTILAEATIDGMRRGGKYRMTAGTPRIPYANPVNKMPERWLRHPATYHANTGRRRDRLNDPGAKEGWYDLIVLNARNLAQRLWNDFIIKTIVPLVKPIAKIPGSGIKSEYNFARSLFTVRFK